MECKILELGQLNIDNVRILFDTSTVWVNKSLLRKVEPAYISIKDLKPEELEKLKKEWVKDRSKILDYTEEELRKIRWMQGTYEDK